MMSELLAHVTHMVMPAVLNGAHVFFPSQGLSGVNSFDDDMFP